MGKYDIIKAKIEIKKRKEMILVKMINLIAMAKKDNFKML